MVAKGVMVVATLCALATAAVNGAGQGAAATQASNPSSTPQPEHGLVAEGKAALAAKRYKEARDLFLQAVSSDPKDYVALHGAGIASLYLRDQEQANKLLEQAISLAPVVDRVLAYNYAVSDFGLGNYRQAAKTLTDYLYANSDGFDEPLLNALGVCLNQTGARETASRDSDEARKFYSVLVTRFEEKRPGMKRWGTKWISAADADARTARMREMETQLDLIAKDVVASEARVDQRHKELQDSRRGHGIRNAKQVEGMLTGEEKALAENKQKYNRVAAEIDDIRPEYPQLLLPMAMDETAPPPFPGKLATAATGGGAGSATNSSAPPAQPVAQGTNLSVRQQAASPPLPAAGSETFLGDWEGDFGVLRVTSGPAGLAMDEPRTGFHSTASKVVGATAMFQWSNYGQIFTLASAGEGWVTVSCYPSTAGGSFNRGELPLVAPHWQARAGLKTARQVVVAGAATPAPQAQVVDPIRQAREITIDAKEGANSSRVSLGPVIKGQRVTFQYIRGQWSNTPRRDFPPGSPDDVPVAHHCVFPLRFCENRSGSVIELGTVPGNTRGRPFTFVADRDIADLVLNQNDPFPNNNVGSVTYRITIDGP